MIDIVKALVRPFIIVWGFIVWGILLLLQIDVPILLQTLISAATLEYFGERATLRLKENSSKEVT